MKRLIIVTTFPDATHKILVAHQLVEERWLVRSVPGLLTYSWPDDMLSQEITFWFALAKGCRLVSDYRLDDEPKGNSVLIGGDAPNSTIITGHGNILRKEDKP